MKALILAAGLGTRLRPLTNNIPKPMVPLSGKPLLEHLISHLKESGISDICINLHHLPDKITGYFGDGSRWGVRIIYKFEPAILGTAGAIKNFEQELDADFLLLYGDMLHRLSLSKLIDFHRGKGGIGTVAVQREGDPSGADIAELDENGQIRRIIPKPHDIRVLKPPLKKMQAIYVFSRRICDYIPANKYCELDHEILPQLVGRELPVFGYPTDEFICDIGTWDRYRQAEDFMARFNS